jgi:para-nitrobenzyl esterase
MAKKGIVFVSINYRVGIFGFFAHPQLTRESGRNASGNYGLMDQLAALRWVQHNIASFGGDPRKVTIAGESAGSISVNALVASPLGKDLFQKAIGESGASFIIPMMSLASAEQEGSKISTMLKAGSLAALRNISAAELLQKTMPYRSLIVDGYVLPSPIASIFANGKNNRVSLLTGWNEDEGIVWGPVEKAEDFKKEAKEKYGADASRFLTFYPAATDSEASVSQSILSRDRVAGVENYSWANAQSNQGSTVYVYRFAHKVPAKGAAANYGAFHAAEISYAYDNLKFSDRPWTQADSGLAATMSGYWANFATTGDPNGPGLPTWPNYHSLEKQIIILDNHPVAGQLTEAATLDFLASKMTSH